MPVLKEPQVEVPGTWESVNPFEGIDTIGQFIPHTVTDNRLLVRYFQDKNDMTLKTWAWFGPGAAGAPGRVHGGSVSAILDEVLGASVWLTGMPVFTATLKIRYRNALAVGTICIIETTLKRKTGKRAHVYGALQARGGKVIAEAEGVYYRIPNCELSEDVKKILERRRG